MRSMSKLERLRQNASQSMPSDLQSESKHRGRKYDTWLLFTARFTRLFAYGALSVVLVFYLTSIGPY